MVKAIQRNSDTVNIRQFGQYSLKEKPNLSKNQIYREWLWVIENALSDCCTGKDLKMQEGNYQWQQRFHNNSECNIDDSFTWDFLSR